ncbi:MAG: hypothetical protein KME42_28175 [Tildeniella nuda ZEHNDER 1965/U140]|jgi:hypothetical protein|nr:hypothetical protein [Tildeniella nuda ZEHNDER 1965/U140]
MTRLVIAILILFAVLIGLKATNSSLWQRNLFSQLNSAPPETRNTGFSSDSTGAAPTNNAGASTTLTTPSQVSADTTPLPSRPLQAVPGAW